MLAGVGTVIVDEIHAVAGNKRGSHLALSLARLDALAIQPPVRIGLSATQKPIQRIAEFLCGGQDCEIVDTGHRRELDISLELPSSPLSAVIPNEVWEELYDRLESLINDHGTTLIFVNTRRLAERLARHLAERLDETIVTAHHGSLSRNHRLEAEQALKSGRLKALVATASLELGIDIGHVDLVCQLGSPGSVSAFLQRVGRSGHQVGAVPKGRLFPLSRDDLVECVALIKAVNAGELDVIRIPHAPLDVLAQQLVAEVGAREWDTDELYTLVRRAWPYRDLDMESFDGVVRMLAEGYSTRRGRRSAWLFHDAINRRLRPRPAARLTALQNGGAIPDHFDYEVVMLPQGHRIGSLNEDFAFESIPGDIFQLGNSSWRILKIEQGRVLVEDAHGQPPTIPFWFGDAPGRSDELSAAVSDLRRDMEVIFANRGPESASTALQADGIDPVAADQLVAYLHAAWQALECLPTNEQIVCERFFDDTGDMHLVVHAPFGSRLMKAWGLALQKRFCRRFNFELQASALDDALILSLGETHSFELDEVMATLESGSVEEVLVQALLDAPMFEVRWRWNATIALGVQRMRNGQRLPPQWQRNQAQDLVAVVFPDQLACLENLSGAREIPDHPLVRQTIDDCLHDTMDIEGLKRLLARLEAGELKVRCVDLTAPSPLSREIINARPYAFLDDTEAENRRTRAISNEPDDLGGAATLSIISVESTVQVRAEAWIYPRSDDELHDGLLQLGFLTRSEYSTGNSDSGAGGDASRWAGWFATLTDDFRACCVRLDTGASWWLATERTDEWLAIHPGSTVHPDPSAVLGERTNPAPDDALITLLRDRMTGLGPVSIQALADQFALDEVRIEQAMRVLQQQGFAIRMQSADKSWCERRLLARIHRYSRQHRRRAAKPVSPAVFGRFLFRWHQLDQPSASLDQGLSQLEGWSAPTSVWEQSILNLRCEDYLPQDLDQRFLSGELSWFRPLSRQGTEHQVVAASPIAIVPRHSVGVWQSSVPAKEGDREIDSPAGRNVNAKRIYAALERHGAMFIPDLERAAGLLRPQLEDGLKMLVYEGAVTADAFSPLRWLLRPERFKARAEKRGLRRGAAVPLGRWSILAGVEDITGDNGSAFAQQQRLATICQALLRRYGVVFRAILQKESLLPPWRLLLAHLRRMEDRGEVRGGRFVDGFSGEQFALPEAVGLLRQSREPAAHPALCVINATDPLNLSGVLLPGPRTLSHYSNRILLEDGLPVARLVADEVEELPGITDSARRRAREALQVVRPWQRGSRA